MDEVGGVELMSFNGFFGIRVYGLVELGCCSVVVNGFGSG